MADMYAEHEKNEMLSFEEMDSFKKEMETLQEELNNNHRIDHRFKYLRAMLEQELLKHGIE